MPCGTIAYEGKCKSSIVKEASNHQKIEIYWSRCFLSPAIHVVAPSSLHEAVKKEDAEHAIVLQYSALNY